MGRRPRPQAQRARSAAEPRGLVVGAWLWTGRAGHEGVLAEEVNGVVVGPALAASGKAKKPPVFARQGFEIAGVLPETAEACASWIRGAVKPGKPWALHTWVPDSDEGNRKSARAAALRNEVLALLADHAEHEREARALQDGASPLVQIALVGENLVAIGALPVATALSPWPGGRARMKVSGAAPSRATMKLAEAFAWTGFAPDPGDRCVDLGAAPGGWTYLLLARGARVIAVDPAKLDPKIEKDRRVTHVRGNAFTFVPDEPVDWLLCDMVWRPLEAAALLSKWGRRRWARYLISNIKLPMKHPLDVLDRVRKELESSGWRDVRARQLYHDRDEVTIAAWRP